MVKLIQNIQSANDGKQYKDNNDNYNNNITKYLESNKDSILGLAEKNYENLVEILTNNSIANASSNPTLSLPSSSSTFQSLSNQSITNRIEEPKSYHNSKGDIAD